MCFLQAIALAKTIDLVQGLESSLQNQVRVKI